MVLKVLVPVAFEEDRAEVPEVLVLAVFWEEKGGVPEASVPAAFEEDKAEIPEVSVPAAVLEVPVALAADRTDNTENREADREPALASAVLAGAPAYV